MFNPSSTVSKINKILRNGFNKTCRISMSKTMKHDWEKLKKAQTNGEMYHVHGAATQ